MSEQLKHIFDKTACLSKRQLKDYVNGLMTREETYAAEHHINSCFFCSDAAEGMSAQQMALAGAEELSSSFLKDHFSLINPQVHLNSMAPSASAAPVIASRRHPLRGKSQPHARTGSLIAIVLLAAGVWWYMQYEKAHRASVSTGGSSYKAKAQEAMTPEEQRQRVQVISDIKPEQIAASTAASTANGKPERPKESPQKLHPLIMTDQKAGAPKGTIPEETAQKPIEKSKQAPGKELSASIKGSAVSKALPAKETAIQKPQGSGTDVPAPSAVSKTETDVPPVSSAKLSQPSGGDPEETAQELYFAGEWSKALIAYRKEMKSDNTRHRQQATIMAARCHINLGQKGPAIQLLKGIVDEGGPQKKAARKMLHELGVDEGW